MPCKVKCSTGKHEMTFPKLKPGSVKTFDCGECDVEEPEEKSSEMILKPGMSMAQAKRALRVRAAEEKKAVAKPVELEPEPEDEDSSGVFSQDS